MTAVVLSSDSLSLCPDSAEGADVGGGTAEREEANLLFSGWGWESKEEKVGEMGWEVEGGLICLFFPFQVI